LYDPHPPFSTGLKETYEISCVVVVVVVEIYMNIFVNVAASMYHNNWADGER